MAFGLMQSCLSPGAEKYSNSEVLVTYVFRFIASCLGVVVVSAFYETKRTADEQVSFAKNDQQVNR